MFIGKLPKSELQKQSCQVNIIHAFLFWPLYENWGSRQLNKWNNREAVLQFWNIVEQICFNSFFSKAFDEKTFTFHIFCLRLLHINKFYKRSEIVSTSIIKSIFMSMFHMSNHGFGIILRFFSSMLINPVHVTGLSLYPLKTSENLWFSDVFRGYRKKPVT